MTCVTTTLMSILLNGSSLQLFNMDKGLRHGDPLSPYLFILVSKALVSMFWNVEYKGFLATVEVGKDRVNVKPIYVWIANLRMIL